MNIYWNIKWISSIESYYSLKKTKGSSDFPEVIRRYIGRVGIQFWPVFHPGTQTIFITYSLREGIVVPKTILWFTDSVGQRELRIAAVLIIIVYYGEGIQIKSSKGKECIGQNPGETGWVSRHLLPVELYGQSLIQQWCVVTWRVLPTRKVRLNFDVQDFYWGSGIVITPHGWSYLVTPSPASLEVRLTHYGPRPSP